MVGNENKVSNYYSVSNGKIVRSFGGNRPEGIQTTERVNKNGNTVYEQMFDFIRGRVVGATLKAHEEYGDNIELTIYDGIEKANLQIKFDSAYGRSFLYKIPNCNFENEITIKPYSFVDKETGKNVLGLFILDPIEKVPNFYTKDKPNGLPPMKEVTFKGKKTWDNTDQIKFLKERFEEFCKSFSKTPPSGGDENQSDDLPF